MFEFQSKNFDPQVIADSGQCFRFEALAPDCYELTALGEVLRIFRRGGDRFALDCEEKAYHERWEGYFDLRTDYRRYREAVPPEDAFLTEALAFGEGIRILRQEPWEMLITFLISQQKNIPAIKRAVALLSEKYGEPIDETHFAFPTAEALAAQGEESFRRCALGYRSPYLAAAARMAAEGELDFAQLEQLPDEGLEKALRAVPGVGPKVANCVMLFGFHRIAAFPRDVWINRMIEREYGGNFPLSRYEGYAGVLQQYIFYYGREGAKHKKNEIPA